MPKANPKRNHKGNAASLDPAHQFKRGNPGGPGMTPLFDSGRKQLTVSVCPEVAESLEAQAKGKGMKTSAYLREILTQAEILYRIL